MNGIIIIETFIITPLLLIDAALLIIFIRYFIMWAEHKEPR